MGSSQDRRQNNAGPSESSTPPFASPISLPKGGGAIRGIGEKFTASPVTGTGAMSVPIATSPGRSGFGPQLSLSYSTGSGNGPFGIGWSLDLPHITRKTDQGLPLYRDGEESDVFLLAGTEDLVPVLDAGGVRFEDTVTAPGFTIHRYRPRVEGLFARIERWTHTADGAIHWRSITRDNVTSEYGTSAAARIADPADPSRVFSWLIARTYDDRGNAMVYEYVSEDAAGVDLLQCHERNRVRTANRYIKRIFYGNRTSRLLDPLLDDPRWMFEVVFDYVEGHYEELALAPGVPAADQHRLVRASNAAAHEWERRPDPFSQYRATFEARTYRRCRRVLMFHHFDELGNEPCLVRSTEVDYVDLDYTAPVTIEAELAFQGSTRFASFIRTVTESGFVRDASVPVQILGGVTYVTYRRKSLPSLEFEYSKASVHDEVREVDPESLENLPVGLDGSAYRWVDVDGEGVSGILTEQAGGWLYKPNLGDATFGPIEIVTPKPSLSNLSGGRQQLLDLAGDGRLDLVDFAGPTPGFYERAEREGATAPTKLEWAEFRSFRSLPNIAWDQPNLRFVDLNGDGHADVLITGQDVFTWYPSLAEEGFGPALHVRHAADDASGPRLVFADGTGSIYLADMSGDGLSDLVQVDNGEICYWPNLGYGRFGAKVTLDNVPSFDHPDQFDQARLRLADIDGSGTTDFIYLGPQEIRLYFNQAGNRLSDPRPITRFPRCDDGATVTAVDLLGNGTASLVWSSPLAGDAPAPMRYIDLMKVKPHLLIKCANNLGVETYIQYASSTRFYLADKRAGRPWVTRIPFPVHVVERTDTFDHVSGNLLVSRKTYHHGYFDGVEREFRGFGMVEQIDTEELAALNQNQLFPVPTNVAPASHVPPMLTRTWYHTGAFLDRNRVSRFFAGLLDGVDVGEYYREPGLTDTQAEALLLDDTVLPPGLSIDEEREACRALRGSMIRQEVYGLDGTVKEPHPYMVAEQNFTVQRLQSKGTNRHAVFFTHARESLAYHYEREPQDPRVTHALTLEVNPFGHVLKSAEVIYGRRNPDLTLADRDRARQGERHLTYTERDFTNAIDLANDYRVPAACESRTFELTGLTLPGSQSRYTFGQVATGGPAAVAIDYEQAPTSGLLQKRLIDRARTLYRRDNFAGALPLGQLQPLAIPFESYKLALTSGLVAEVYGGRVTDAMLSDDGGYVHSAGDLDWWVPSGRTFYSPDPAHTEPQELVVARAHFFLPRRHRDPFHTALVSTERFVTYDVHDLLVQETRDALDNRITAGERDPNPALPLIQSGLDYRVLGPTLAMDPNRNRSAVLFDALGMVVATAIMGKPEDVPAKGDLLDNAVQDLTDGAIAAHMQNPLANPQALLGHATSRLVYDLFAYFRTRALPKPQPAVVYTLARETHHSDPVPAGGVRYQHGFSYSDGFGREIQRKLQAEPGPVPQRDALGTIIIGADGEPLMTSNDVAPRWVGTGWTVVNNKGNPVRKFEPFFTDTHQFEFDVRIGVSLVQMYDPLERVVATLRPDHTWEKGVFGPWREETWDESDTVLVADPKTDPDVGDYFARLPLAEYAPTWHAQRIGGALGAAAQAAAEKAAVHAATPMVAHRDSNGRTFLTVAHNRYKYSNAPPAEELLLTRVQYDIESNAREVRDALDRVVMRFDYDMLGIRLRQTSMESGERWMLSDAAGQPIHSWDSRNHQLQTRYDAERRPTDVLLRTGAAAPRVVGRTVYGESQPAPEAKNLRGKPVEVFDQAGVVGSDEYDFKGGLISSRRILAAEYRTVLDWSVPQPMELDTHTTRTRYDALNRPVEIITPDQSVIRPGFNDANLLERVDANLRAEQSNGLPVWTPFVTDIDYDAQGQRTEIAFANGVRTSYAYDRLSSRLVTLRTRRDEVAFPGDCPQPPPAGWPGCRLQNLSYTYDAVGNVTRIRDDAQQIVYFLNQRVDPSADYTYDGLDRLIEATGREHRGQVAAPPVPDSYNDAPRVGVLFSANDGHAMGRYLERFFYDGAGNLRELAHIGTGPANPGWTRTFLHDETAQLESLRRSNRLTSSSVNGTPEIYSAGGNGYDAHGNMLRMPHLQTLEWNYLDRLVMTERQAVNAADAEGVQRHGERTYYVYDATGQRVRKVTELAGGQRKDERIYLGGFEIYRRSGVNALVRETLHVLGTRQRFALVETRTDTAAPQRLIRYQHDNHLGSASLELDEQARIISYEEYTPYGSTSLQAVSSQTVAPKRYRYTGKERDEETGFTYHGARYYIPWLARWVSADPIGLQAGLNLYAYVRGNPVRLIDPGGTEDAPPKKEELGFFKKAGLVASVGFTVITGQTPSQFGQGMLDKAKSVTVDPVMTLYGPGGMLDKAAQKAADKVMGIERPDDYYVTKEEHDKQLRAIVSVGATLLPPVKIPGGGAAAGPALATPEGVVIAGPAVASKGATVTVAPAAAGGAALTTGGGKGKPAPKEPGQWVDDATAGTNMSADQAKYQKQVTGKPASKTYHVGSGSKSRSFDGFEPGKGGAPDKLIEAKHLSGDGRFVKAYENMKKGNFSDLENLVDRAGKILDQAKDQLKAAEGTGARIEWRVSSREGEEALNVLFSRDPATKGKIDVVYVPFKK
jgi:RHS repeat-associated protein